MKRIILAVGAAIAGLTACSHTTVPTATSHGSVRVPVSCSQQYNTWKHGQGKELIAALDAVSSAQGAGDIRVLTVTLRKVRPAVVEAASHPMPACADPRGYWDVLLMHVSAAAAPGSSTSSVRAAMTGVPEIENKLIAEVKRTTRLILGR